jgi:hypothetical protein
LGTKPALSDNEDETAEGLLISVEGEDKGSRGYPSRESKIVDRGAGESSSTSVHRGL